MTVVNNANPERTENQTTTSTPPVVETSVAGRAADHSAVDAVKAERARILDIRALSQTSKIDLEAFITGGRSLEEARSHVLEEMLRNQEPINTGGGTPQVQVREEAEQKFRSAASDSILIRGAIAVTKPAEGAQELRGMSLRDIAIECLERTGENKARRMDNTELFQRALTPDSQFAGILSDSVNKSMAKAYEAQRPTFTAWTGKGSNRDFKKAKYYRLSEAGDLERVQQNGELKFDELSDEVASTQIFTYGKMFGFTREAMINDDLSMLTRVPQRYVASALRGANRMVYVNLNKNQKAPDGKALFHIDHANTGTAGHLSVATLGEARRLMRNQKNIAGKEALNIAPKYLLVPPALETEAQQLLRSVADPNGAHSGVVNPFYSSLELIVDAELSESPSPANSPWYLAADQMLIDTIVVSYLNGQESPILESQVGFDFLGIKWRILYDVGVDLMDFRGFVKTAGA